MSAQADLSADLRAYLIDALYAHAAQFRGAAHWVMNEEWWHECRRMTGPDGRVLWEPSWRVDEPDLPLGKPVEVREDGEAPHLERDA